jgi:hypothetical protein
MLEIATDFDMIIIMRKLQVQNQLPIWKFLKNKR